MRATTLWTALTLSTVFFAAQANAEKTTYANQTGQRTIGQESSAVGQFASGDWRVERQQVDQQGPQMPMQPGPNPYVAMDPYGQMMMPGMAAPYGVAPAGYGMPMEAGYGMAAPGQPMMDPNVMPAGHMGGYGGCASCGGAGCQSCMGGRGGHFGGCQACGGAGCGGCCGLTGGGVYCGFSRGIGNAWDMSNYGGRCAPRYFDVSVDATFFMFEPGNANNTVLSSQAAANNPVLSTEDVDFNFQGGTRMTLQRSAFVGSYFEFSYLGMGNWSSLSSVSGAGDLFSPFSRFGVDPVGGYAETDNANFQSFATSNNFDSFELNLRRFFTSPNCWWQASYWVGFRYVRMADDSIYLTAGNTGSMIYTVDATNDMFGAQLGLDSTLKLTTRWSLTAFGEAGVYGNAATQKSTLDFTGGGPVYERATQRRASLVAEGGFMSTFRLAPRATLRAGYQVVYIDGVALSSDNFNFSTGGASPLGTALAGRAAVVNDNGNAVYHGPTVGFEYTW